MTDNPQITIAQIQNRCTPQVFERGEAYFKKGAITKMRWSGSGINAFCRGSHGMTYRVSILLKAEQVVWTHCDCPYRNEGDCKHVIALLLTYLNHPEQVQSSVPIPKPAPKQSPPPPAPKPLPPKPVVPLNNPPPVPKQPVPLRERSQHELVQLIYRMMQRYPDLEEIVNPLPPSSEMIHHREDLKHAFFQYEDNLDEEGTAREIVKLATIGDGYAERGEWVKAQRIYIIIIDMFVYEVTPRYHRLQGFFAIAMRHVVGSMERCIGQLTEAHPRLKIIEGWVKMWTWQVRYDYPEVGGDVLSMIYATIQYDEVPPIRVWIKSEANLVRYGNRWDDKQARYDGFLRVLAIVRSQKPTRLIQELSEQGMLQAYIKRLLVMGQVQEAAQVLTNELRQGSRRVEGLQALWDGGQQELALSLAKMGMAVYLDGDVIEWALKMCHQHDPYKEVEWMMLYVRYTRQMHHYESLKEMAQIYNRWDEVYSQLIEDVEKSGDNALLIDIYLHDEKWDLAWRTLRKVEALPEGDSGGLDLRVAQASCDEYPERAIPVYMKYVHQHIAQRNREGYAEAVRLLNRVQELYEQLDEFERWERAIASMRTQYKTLRTFLDEVKRAGL